MHKCKWKFEDTGVDGGWDTGCNEIQLFIADGPEENNYRFCPYCGGEIVIERGEDDEQIQ